MPATRVRIALAVSAIVVAAGASVSGDDARAVFAAPPALVSPIQEPALPAGAADAVARLDASPRHGEWAVIRSGDDSIRAFVVYPERSDAAPVVLVVHEIFGLSHWIRAVADQLAAEGFIAIAPDLLTMRDVPAGADGAPLADAARAAIQTLDRADVQRWLRATAEWGLALPAAANRYGIVGFCWGGTVSFQHAAAAAPLGAAVVYYGSSPDAATLARVRSPVLGLYAGEDARVNATIDAARHALAERGSPFDVHIFDNGSGHGFLRQQDGRDGANLAAARGAWPLTLAFFRRQLEG
jgi:carboxymethylenebutenolidase